MILYTWSCINDNWLDNRNIASVFVDLNVTIFCCFFYSCLHHSNSADEMFYKQNDIEPVPVGCQEIASAMFC
jgi:putative ribosome biogenesis GTPase RsgA